MFHTGRRQPSATAPAERDPDSPRDAGYRLPRIAIDLVGARPVDLAIVDGIETQAAAAEGLTPPAASRAIRVVTPGLLVAGFNPVCTDAVATALMGFDPAADRGTPPFERGDSTLKLAEEAGIGTRDLARIEVVGGSIDALRFPFLKPQ